MSFRTEGRVQMFNKTVTTDQVDLLIRGAEPGKSIVVTWMRVTAPLINTAVVKLRDGTTDKKALSQPIGQTTYRDLFDPDNAPDGNGLTEILGENKALTLSTLFGAGVVVTLEIQTDTVHLKNVIT